MGDCQQRTRCNLSFHLANLMLNAIGAKQHSCGELTVRSQLQDGQLFLDQRDGYRRASSRERRPAHGISMPDDLELLCSVAVNHPSAECGSSVKLQSFDRS